MLSTPKFYRPTPPTSNTPKFDPRQPRTDAPTLPTSTMHRCHQHRPRYLADSKITYVDNSFCFLGG